MKYTIGQLIRVVVGLFVFSVGIVMTINASLGVSPWDVFHQGLSNTLGITLGQANIIVGFFIIFLDIILGQNIGWATLLNMMLIGIFIDLLMLNHIIPESTTILAGVIMLLTGILIEGYGCFIYVSAGMGAGPRDGLMVVLTKRTGKSVRMIKTSIEIVAVIVGMILGGKFGIGTVIMATFGGQIFQAAFRSVKFDIKEVRHRFIQDDIKLIRQKG